VIGGHVTRATPTPQHLGSRVAALVTDERLAALDTDGSVVIGGVLAPETCRAIAALYADDARFRSRIVMARHGFGRGEYKYFADPLPDAIAMLRAAFYAPLATVANRWSEQLGRGLRHPTELGEWLDRCHAAGQCRPTPLLLRYAAGDWNCLHQDVYGELVFPIQVAILLSDPRRDFTGGELVLAEQRPRQQSRVRVVPLAQGDAVAFAVRDRPVRGSRGVYRANVRHGVSELRSGERTTLGLIFHDAR
jgi:hypothetical protein